MDKTDPMEMALRLARLAGDAGEVPVGAVIVEAASGEVVASAANVTEQENDPTGHAELIAIRAAASLRSEPRLADCDLYVTLEPCPMCAQAIAFARLRRVVFGAYDPKGGGVDHGPRIFRQPTCHHRPEVVGGVREQEASALLKEFFRARR